jgi:hypothetical protein
MAVFRISENPHNICVTWDIIPDVIKPLFYLPYQEQGEQAWRDIKLDHVSASEVDKLLGHNKEGWEDKDDLFGYKTNSIPPKIIRKFTQDAFDHGHENEPVISFMIAYKNKDVMFKFGMLKHKDPVFYFLGASLDRLSLSQKIYEFKAPRYRLIPEPEENEPVDERIEETVFQRADGHNVLVKRGISAERMKNELPYYWDQCQLQLEIVRSHTGDFFKEVHFVQYGTWPNQHYLEHSIAYITIVPYDPKWIEDGKERFINFWKSVENYRQENPGWKEYVWPEPQKLSEEELLKLKREFEKEEYGKGIKWTRCPFGQNVKKRKDVSETNSLEKDTKHKQKMKCRFPTKKVPQKKNAYKAPLYKKY